MIANCVQIMTKVSNHNMALNSKVMVKYLRLITGIPFEGVHIRLIAYLARNTTRASENGYDIGVKGHIRYATSTFIF